jgi:hypothetical protein
MLYVPKKEEMNSYRNTATSNNGPNRYNIIPTAQYSIQEYRKASIWDTTEKP